MARPVEYPQATMASVRDVVFAGELSVQQSLAALDALALVTLDGERT